MLGVRDLPAARCTDIPPAWTNAADLTTSIYEDLTEAAPLRGAWDHLVATCHGDVYFTYDWCRAWWAHYGRRRRSRVFVFHADGELVGIIPLVVERVWIGPLSVRLGRLMGADSTLAVLHPPVQRRYAAAAYRKVIAHVLGGVGCEALSFSHLSGECDLSADIRRACQAPQRVYMVLDRSTAPYTVLHLPATFDDYLNSLSKSERKGYRQDARRLSECGTLTMHRYHGVEELATAIVRFEALHRKQWRQIGKQGHFDDWPDSAAFTRRLLRDLASFGRAEVSEMMLDDITLVMQLSFRLGTSLYWRLPARNVDPEWERYSIGRIAAMEEIKEAIASGVTRIEAGAGHYPYKQRLGGSEYRLRSLLITRALWWPRLKARILCAWADLLNLAYYRIWFQRLAPRLFLCRRPLWRSWIRTRL